MVLFRQLTSLLTSKLHLPSVVCVRSLGLIEFHFEVCNTACVQRKDVKFYASPFPDTTQNLSVVKPILFRKEIRDSVTDI